MRLTRIFRQAAGSMIVQGAHAIRRGEMPEFMAGSGMRPKNGRTERSHPNTSPMMSAPPLAEFTPWTYQSARYPPVPGRMLLFPSWLYHSVEPNLSDRERVSLSFNIGFRFHSGS